jgi:hypothetical protein
MPHTVVEIGTGLAITSLIYSQQVGIAVTINIGNKCFHIHGIERLLDIADKPIITLSSRSIKRPAARNWCAIIGTIEKIILTVGIEIAEKKFLARVVAKGRLCEPTQSVGYHQT